MATSWMSDSVAWISVVYGSLPPSGSTTKSPRRPVFRRPSCWSHPSASAALHVAIAQIACGGNCLVSLLEWICRSATVSSPSRLFDPDGDQSAPRQMRIPLLCAVATSVVLPYSHRLLNGDHTNEPGLADALHCANCAAPSAVEWIPIHLCCSSP